MDKTVVKVLFGDFMTYFFLVLNNVCLFFWAVASSIFLVFLFNQHQLSLFFSEDDMRAVHLTLLQSHMISSVFWFVVNIRRKFRLKQVKSFEIINTKGWFFSQSSPMVSERETSRNNFLPTHWAQLRLYWFLLWWVSVNSKWMTKRKEYDVLR